MSDPFKRPRVLSDRSLHDALKNHKNSIEGTLRLVKVHHAMILSMRKAILGLILVDVLAGAAWVWSLWS